ncbi:hypothetical protein CsSME_00042494 [Camellia sinensis var. sinensis]
MNQDDEDDARMNRMEDDVVALAVQWKNQMNCAYVETYRIAIDYYKADVLKVPYCTSILMGRAWIVELYNGHNSRFRYE